jgi:shikimate 5-dehydrogenase
MLVNQGALNFSLWTGVEPDRSVMFECLKREFNG